MWKDGRDVRLLSTKHAPILVPVNVKNTTDSAALDQPSQIDAVPAGHNSNTNSDTSDINDTESQENSQEENEIPIERTNEAQNPIPKKKLRKATEKPLGILEYNKGKAGIDISGKVVS